MQNAIISSVTGFVLTGLALAVILLFWRALSNPRQPAAALHGQSQAANRITGSAQESTAIERAVASHRAKLAEEEARKQSLFELGQVKANARLNALGLEPAQWRMDYVNCAWGYYKLVATTPIAGLNLRFVNGSASDGGERLYAFFYRGPCGTESINSLQDLGRAIERLRQ